MMDDASNIPVPNRMQKKPLRWHEYREIRAVLVERFPDCFVSRRQAKKPLAKSIHRALFTADLPFSNAEVGGFLHKYCGSRKYLAAMVEGASRIDLYGNPVSIVKANDERVAKERMERKGWLK